MESGQLVGTAVGSIEGTARLVTSPLPPDPPVTDAIGLIAQRLAEVESQLRERLRTILRDEMPAQDVPGEVTFTELRACLANVNHRIDDIYAVMARIDL